MISDGFYRLDASPVDGGKLLFRGTMISHRIHLYGDRQILAFFRCDSWRGNDRSHHEHGRHDGNPLHH
nr:hypothetical protein [Halomonas elongata]